MPAGLARLAVSESRFGHVLLGFMGAGFLALIAAVGVTAWTVQRNQLHTYWVNHTFRVELTVADARRRLEQAEGVRRGYLLFPQPSFIPAFHQAVDGLPASLDQLASLTRDNPVQRTNLRGLRNLVATQIARQQQTFALVGAGRRVEAIGLYADEVRVHPVTRIRATYDAVAREERALLTVRDREQKASTRAFYVILAVSGVLLGLVTLLTLLVVRRFTRDLTASRDSLRALNGSLEDAVAERTADLTRANEEIQRFAYIVSHDLRSPLVNVMGFTAELESAARVLAELVARADEQCPDVVTEDARLAAREDLPEAIRFIRTSTQKMDRLINAILKLSREGRRVITPEPIDLVAVACGIRDSLQHRLDEQGTELAVDTPMPVLVSDRLAVEQILSNLVENAVKYLQPGRPGRIAVRAHRTGDRITIAVEDNGRGIDPRDHSRVFDLFRRSGVQDQPGEGIGLAHVRALAYRLGGIVDMTSELGQGATFRLTLPVAQDQETSR